MKPAVPQQRWTGPVGRIGASWAALSAIAAWVTAHFGAATVGGVTVYDLRNAAS